MSHQPGSSDTPALSASPAAVLAGGTVSLAVTGDPGGRLDWVGLYKSASSDEGLIDWMYLSGSKTAPDTGTQTATLTFAMPAAAGTYDFRLFANDSYSKLAISNEVQVGDAPVLTVTPASVAAGGAVVVGVSHAPGNPLDWLGLVKSGDPDSAVVDWMYLDGTKTPPSEGATSAYLFFTMPSKPGSYDLRLFANNGYERLAQSGPIEVRASLDQPLIVASPAYVLSGGSATVQISGGPGGRLDWVGVYRSTSADEGLIDWMYLSGSKTPPDTGLKAATLTFPLPTPSNSYNLRLFANDSYTKLAQSNDVRVIAPRVEVSATSVAPGQQVTVTISDGPGSPTDWVGLGRAGEGDHVVLEWAYLNGSDTAPVEGLRAATLTFIMPPAGDYVFRLFAEDGTRRLAESPVISDCAAGSCGIRTLVGGGGYSFALKNNGTLWGWGSNSFGQLGDATTMPHSSPVHLGAPSGVTAVALGLGHSLAATSDGPVWAWGYNSLGGLGDGTTILRTSPVLVRALSGVVALAAGSGHSLAVRSDGTVWAWGSNGTGQLGAGFFGDYATPVQVSMLDGVIALAAASQFSLALRADGTAWGWGDGRFGQLGDGGGRVHATPIQITALRGMTAIAAGSGHGLGLKDDGSVWAWGRNDFGEVGDGTTTPAMTPVQVRGLDGIIAIAAGNSYSLALRRDGTAWTWGLNSSGQLGNGTTANSTAPVQVSVITGVVAIGAGQGHGLAAKRDGSVWAWGLNDSGQLGDGTQENRFAPVRVLMP